MKGLGLQPWTFFSLVLFLCEHWPQIFHGIPCQADAKDLWIARALKFILIMLFSLYYLLSSTLSEGN